MTKLVKLHYTADLAYPQIVKLLAPTLVDLTIETYSHEGIEYLEEAMRAGGFPHLRDLCLQPWFDWSPDDEDEADDGEEADEDDDQEEEEEGSISFLSEPRLPPLGQAGQAYRGVSQFAEQWLLNAYEAQGWCEERGISFELQPTLVMRASASRCGDQMLRRRVETEA